MKTSLKDVTICAIDCVNISLASKAIDKSLLECIFGDAILFSDKPPADIKNKKWIAINKISEKNGYSNFVLKDLHKYIETSFALIVQWDGYVLDGRKWDDIFYKYDYIGAPWHWHKDGMNVGNGGFSLRSKRLLEAVSKNDYPFVDSMNEDDQICRHYRPSLISQHSINYAPEGIANLFSYERSLPSLPTFGFHGIFNIWRHLNDLEIEEFIAELNPYIFHTIEYFELTLQYLAQRKFNTLEILFRQIKLQCSTEQIKKNYQKLTDDPKTCDWIIETLYAL